MAWIWWLILGVLGTCGAILAFMQAVVFVDKLYWKHYQKKKAGGA